jgi:hypothetical protein
MKPSILYISQQPTFILRVYNLLDQWLEKQKGSKQEITEEIRLAILVRDNLTHPKIVYKEEWVQYYLLQLSESVWQAIWDACPADERDYLFESKLKKTNPVRGRRVTRHRPDEGFYSEMLLRTIS